MKNSVSYLPNSDIRSTSKLIYSKFNNAINKPAWREGADIYICEFIGTSQVKYIESRAINIVKLVTTRFANHKLGKKLVVGYLAEGSDIKRYYVYVRLSYSDINKLYKAVLK